MIETFKPTNIHHIIDTLFTMDYETFPRLRVVQTKLNNSNQYMNFRPTAFVGPYCPSPLNINRPMTCLFLVFVSGIRLDVCIFEIF